MQEISTSQTESDSGFRIFAILWAYVNCLELLSFPFWLLTFTGWAVFFAAGWVLMNPDSVPRFAVLVVAVIAKIFHEMPFIPNHILFTWMLNLTILAVFLFQAARNRGKVDGGEWFAGFAPLFRALLVVLYVISAVQKLNHDYLDPGLSCAVVLFRDTAAEFGIWNIADWMNKPAIYGSLVVEFGVPVLLLVRRTRLVGIAVGVLFHGFLAFHPSSGVFGFTTLMFILFMLFLPGKVFARLANARNWTSLKSLKIGNGKAMALLFMVMVFGVIRAQVWLYLNLGEDFEIFSIAYRMALWFWVVTTIWFLALVAAAMRGFPMRLPLIGRTQRIPVLLALFLPLLNATMPWVGGKTQTSFSMFSNLRTEFGENHVFLRRNSWLGFQDNLVEVVQSDPDIFSSYVNKASAQQHANTGHIMPMFELRRLAFQVKGPLEVRFKRHGILERAVRDAEGNLSGTVEVFDAPGYLSRKFLWFRRHVTMEGPMHCTH